MIRIASASASVSARRLLTSTLSSSSSSSSPHAAAAAAAVTRTFASNSSSVAVIATSASTTIPDVPATSAVAVDTTIDKLFQDQQVSNTVSDALAVGTWDPTWYNVADQAVHGIQFFRETVGVGYAEAIVGTTILVRVALFPLFVKLQRNSARMAHMQPEMKALKTQLDAAGSNVDQDTQVKYGLQMRALFQKYDCNPLSSLVAPLVQMPVFMGMFFGLRKMPEYFSSDLSQEGLFWFTDLTIADPYYILPVVSAMTMLASVEMNKEQMMATNPDQGKIMVNVFRAMSIVMVPAIANFPASLNLYWFINNSITAGQAGLFKTKGIRKMLNIWEMPKPVPGMPQSQTIVQTITDAVQRKPSEADVMKDHNEAVDNKKKMEQLMATTSTSTSTTGNAARRGRKRFRQRVMKKR
eukprot:CAMPEP_0119004722 /NCGR_PEP_ID=MMETSP1176-20130426/1315_1 /TAXON_ID=265551 /ORGANISM="Synedropsis recta cf, Strain CCMP1620" /LENGTH=410 /DNA_ID=CAMNT_0006956463 /DNA_START=126 /DNA_END=1358 /DNA_ORIENTATION=+